jgi:hypothetical protein
MEGKGMGDRRDGKWQNRGKKIMKEHIPGTLLGWLGTLSSPALAILVTWFLVA